MKKNAVETDRRRVKKLVEGKNFDFLIMSLICMDAVILGLMTSDAMNRFFEGGLFILDRLFMAIFIIEMIMKIFCFRQKVLQIGLERVRLCGHCDFFGTVCQLVYHFQNVSSVSPAALCQQVYAP